MTMRAQLILGKYQVMERSGPRVRIKLGGTTEMTLDLGLNHDQYDVRPGDLLTFYTEVLFKPRKDA